MVGYRLFKVWRRDFAVWKKYFLASFVTNFGEPLLYLFAMGYGLGNFIQGFGGLTYPEFIAPAILVISVMHGASFETTFSSYTRMEVQKTFHGIAMTPVSIQEVIAGEILWAATKSMMTSVSIFLVLFVLDLVHSPWVLLVPVLMLIVGLLFASLGMLMTSFARSYDFFTYYFTLFISPMFVFSGTFFPVDPLPAWARTLANFLPLTHAVRVSRDLFAGNFGWPQAGAMLGMLGAAVVIATFAIRRVARRIIV